MAIMVGTIMIIMTTIILYDGEDEPFSLWQSVAEVFEAIKEIPCRDAMIALLLQQRRVTKQFNSIVIL